MTTFDCLKKYITKLEQLENLFLMYQKINSKAKDHTTNITLRLIKSKYRRINRGLVVRQYSLKYFKRKANKLIADFIERYQLKEVTFDMTAIENKYNSVRKECDSQLYGLYLVECREFVKKYTEIIKVRRARRVLKKMDIKIETPDEDFDTVVCVSCMVEIKTNLLKYHLNSKKHKRLRRENDKIVQIKGNIKKAEEQLKKLQEMCSL